MVKTEQMRPKQPKPPPIVIEGTMPIDERSARSNDCTGYEYEDGGAVLIARIADDRVPICVDLKSSSDPDDGAGQDNHATFHALCGKRVRITIEVLN